LAVIRPLKRDGEHIVTTNGLQVWGIVVEGGWVQRLVHSSLPVTVDGEGVETCGGGRQVGGGYQGGSFPLISLDLTLVV
jgi:hypothetical protein